MSLFLKDNVRYYKIEIFEKKLIFLYYDLHKFSYSYQAFSGNFETISNIDIIDNC